MLLQVIPYVADQFEPGAYVFDGENLSGSHIFSTTGPVSVYALSDKTFNAQELLISGAAQAVYDMDLATIKKVDMLYSIDALIMSDFESNQVFSAVATSDDTYYLVGSDTKQIQSVQSIEPMYSTVYISYVSGQIQNDLGSSPFFPSILDTRTLDEPAIVKAGFNDTSIENMNSHSQPTVDYAIDVVAKPKSNLAVEKVLDTSELDLQKPNILNIKNDDKVQGATIKFVSIIGSRFEPDSSPSNNPRLDM